MTRKQKAQRQANDDLVNAEFHAKQTAKDLAKLNHEVAIAHKVQRLVRAAAGVVELQDAAVTIAAGMVTLDNAELEIVAERSVKLAKLVLEKCEQEAKSHE